MYFFSFSNESTFSQSEKLRILSEIPKLTDPFGSTIFFAYDTESDCYMYS